MCLSLVDLFKLSIHHGEGEHYYGSRGDGGGRIVETGKEDLDHDELELEVANVLNQVSKVQYETNDCFDSIRFNTDHLFVMVIEFGYGGG